MRWFKCLRWYAATSVLRCSPLNRALCALVEMDMEITIRRIETESIEDKGIFETLFIEYLSGSGKIHVRAHV